VFLVGFEPGPRLRRARLHQAAVTGAPVSDASVTS
jgi:hypothetical protein